MSHEAAASALNGHPPQEPDDEDNMLDADEADEEVTQDEDAAMESGDEDIQQEIQLQNDSIAHFDGHSGNSIFCIAQHPTHPSIVATGGGDDEEEAQVGFGFVFDVNSAPTHDTTSTGGQPKEREGIKPLQKLEGHTDSITCIAFTLPDGRFLLTAGMDGRITSYQHQRGASPPYTLVTSAQEVEEITFLAPCPNAQYPNTIAAGASDGSIWVYTATDSGLEILNTYYIHTSAATAGCWTPDGKLLCTISEDGSFYTWDVFGEASAAGMASIPGQQYIVGLTADDERFRIEGGLYSIAVEPSGAYAAIGGAEGQIRVVGLPRFASSSSTTTAGGQSTKSGGGAKSKVGGGKQAGDKTATGSGGAGMILASLGVQSNSVETLSFLQTANTVLLASGSSDGSIAIFDAKANFTVRRKIPKQIDMGEGGEEGDEVVKVRFVPLLRVEDPWVLSSFGFDGVLRRWDVRSAGASGSERQGLIGEWRGHQGGNKGYIEDVVQGMDGGRYVVTAGDDGVVLVFDMTNPPKSG